MPRHLVPRQPWTWLSKTGQSADVAAFMSDSGARVTYSAGGVAITAFAGNARAIRPFDIISGKWPVAGDGGQGVVLNIAARDRLGNPAYVQWVAGSGDTPHRSPVVAVIRDAIPDPQAYISWPTLARFGNTATGSTLTVFARLPSTSGDLSKQWLVDSTQRMSAPAHDAAAVDIITEINAQLLVIEAAFLAVALIMLLVGVVGVVNVGLATLKDRAEELALRRSLGATKGDIFGLVLIESILVGVASSGVAVCLSLALYAPIIGTLLSSVTAISFPTTAAGIGVLTGTVAGALAGIIPAWRAAHMQIATVMRA